MLISQSRHDMAEQELRQALAGDPNDADAHALLAICLCERQQYRAATGEAQHAIHLAPANPLPHYVHALVFYRRNRFDEAEDAIHEALELDPYDPDYFALLAHIFMANRRWRDALSVAEEGLEIDPEHIECTNLRATALVRLGHKDAAGETIEAALARAPEDADTHANQGWTLIEQGQHQKAMEHFREALRLDPESEWARLGIIEAMKSRYFLYRLILNYFLWMMKLTQRMQWTFVIGAFLGYLFLMRLKDARPEWSAWILPLLILYVAWVLMTWLAEPLFNLALRLNRFGRLALSREEVISSNWVGICVLGALVFLVLHFASELPASLVAALAFVFMIPPLRGIYHCHPGSPRAKAIVVAVLMAAIGFFASVPWMVFDVLPKPLAVLFALPGLLCLRIFPYAAIGSQFAINYLISLRPRL